MRWTGRRGTVSAAFHRGRRGKRRGGNHCIRHHPAIHTEIVADTVTATVTATVPSSPPVTDGGAGRVQMDRVLEGDATLRAEFRRYHPGLAYLYWIKAQLGKAVPHSTHPPTPP